MKFVCDRKILLDAINTVSKAVSSKATVSALEGILLYSYMSDESSGLRLTGYDLEIGIETTIEADVSELGAVVVNSRQLGDIVRKGADSNIYFSCDDKMLITIKCGTSTHEILGISSEDFPQLPEFSEDKRIEADQQLLKKMIKQTLYAVSQNMQRPILTGAKFILNDGKLVVVSSDAYRLAVAKTEEEKLKSFGDIDFVVPGKTLNELLKIFDDMEKTIKIGISQKHIMFVIDNVMVVSRLLAGEFLNYENSIPQDCIIKAKVNVRQFIDSIERVSLLINEKMSSHIKLNIDDESIELTCTTAIGRANDEVLISSEGGKMEIGFSHRYLLDALHACETDEVIFQLKSPLSPAIIMPEEGDAFIHLVVPVRMREK